MNDPNDGFMDPIHLNVIHQEIALKAASDLLKASAVQVKKIPGLPHSDVLICFHALLTYQQYESGHPNGFQRLMTESIANLAEKLTDITESIDSASADVCTVQELKALNPEQALAALKEKWLHFNPEHADVEYHAAIVEFEKLLGL